MCVTQTLRNQTFTAGFAVLILFGLVAGFWSLGSPRRQRDLTADEQRLRDLSNIAFEIARHRDRLPKHAMPVSLRELRRIGPPLAIADPLTAAPYQYRIIDRSHYELCAVFSTQSQQGSTFWAHGQGRHCFVLQADAPPTPFY